MFHLFPHQIPAKQAKEIQSWLAAPGGRALVNYLSLKDAEVSAEMANKLLTKEEFSPDEAGELAQKAAFFRKVIDLLNEMSNPDYKFEYQEPLPMPATISTPTEE